MAWRREVARAKGTPGERRPAGVHAVKIALGERGIPWWTQSEEDRRARWNAEVPSPEPARGRT